MNLPDLLGDVQNSVVANDMRLTVRMKPNAHRSSRWFVELRMERDGKTYAIGGYGENQAVTVIDTWRRFRGQYPGVLKEDRHMMPHREFRDDDRMRALDYLVRLYPPKMTDL